MTRLDALVTIAQVLARLRTNDHAINVTRSVLESAVNDADIFLKDVPRGTHDSYNAFVELCARYSLHPEGA